MIVTRGLGGQGLIVTRGLGDSGVRIPTISPIVILFATYALIEKLKAEYMTETLEAYYPILSELVADYIPQNDLVGLYQMVVLLDAEYNLIVELEAGQVTIDNQNFEMEAGDYRKLHFVMVDDFDGDLGTFTAMKFEMVAHLDDETPVVQKTLGSGITAVADKVVEVELDPADTADLEGTLYYAIQVEDTGGGADPVTIAKGIATIHKAVIT